MTQHRVDQMNEFFRQHNQMMNYTGSLATKRSINNMGQSIKNKLMQEGYVLAWDKNGLSSIVSPPTHSSLASDAS